MKIRHELTPYFCETYGIDRDKDYPVEWVDSRTLLVSERLDLVAKLKYIEARENGRITPFIRECYVKHIEAFSYGTFKESGSPEKDTIEKYFASFDQLIDAIKISGFEKDKSVVPVGKDNVLLDGAHRVSAAIYFNKKVPIIRLPDAKVTYDAAYFRKRLLDRRCLDFLVLEYAKLKETVQLAYVFPAIVSKLSYAQKIRKAINQEGKLIYSIKINPLNTSTGAFSSIFENSTLIKNPPNNHSPKSCSLYLFETVDKAGSDAIQAHAQQLFQNSKYTRHFETDPEKVRQQLMLLSSAGPNTQFPGNWIIAKNKQVYKWMVYKQRIWLLRSLKRLGLFTAFRKIYRGLRRNALSK